ncbi:MAG: hypothetical protein JW793_14330 [Acidobacteria bacterium]|nr:hypothetical protein [Acidobacteriota bacterium]
MDKAQYQKYLASREWALLKEQVKQRSQGRCERCLVCEYDSIHHLTYERIGKEDLRDLQAVCRRCHEFLSGKREDDQAISVLFYLAFMATNLHWGTFESTESWVSKTLTRLKPLILKYAIQVQTRK